MFSFTVFISSSVKDMFESVSDRMFHSNLLVSLEIFPTHSAEFRSVQILELALQISSGFQDIYSLSGPSLSSV